MAGRPSNASKAKVDEVKNETKQEIKTPEFDLVANLNLNMKPK